MYFELENETGRITMKKDDITIGDIMKATEMLGIEKEEPGNVELDDFGKIKKYEKENKEVPRVLKSENKTKPESTGFTIGEMLGEEKPEVIPGENPGPEMKKAYIKCPECHANGHQEVPHYFNHTKCNNCGQRVYLERAEYGNTDATDENGNYFIGEKHFFTAPERKEHKRNKRRKELEEKTVGTLRNIGNNDYRLNLKLNLKKSEIIEMILDKEENND